ncbi:hypothetical protein BJ322DRAFT_1108158 [Thelephora terrestris]|uniref:Uncharacterized protein n=1 Tax=Thelephora terrestris TaxID=56493 RepID=A0A9P6HFR4_9AGAM|nr:hypothetical protein BJ322DRAFT_1108158 [Thelephora terrestris]
MVTPPGESNPQGELRLTPQEAEEIKEKSRWLRRVANPFVDFYVIISIGAAGASETAGVAQQHENRQMRDHAKDLTPIQRKIYAEDFAVIVGHLPFLKNRLESNDPSRFIQKILHQVQSAASRARQSDTKTIKVSIVKLIPQEYLPLDANGNQEVNAYQDLKVKNPDSSKSWRGWEHPITARLLCPADHLAEFKADPKSARAKLRDGKLSLLDSKGDPKFPAFLYNEDIMDGSLAQGLFRGPLLLAVYIHIFFSPSGATGAKASLKRGNAKIHGMEKVVPSTICYAAIQAYVALCCAAEWKEEWKGIKFPRLYILLREQFAYPDDPWHADTLRWWNDKVYGTPRGANEDVPEIAQETKGPSTRERSEYERQQRIQAAAAQNT